MVGFNFLEEELKSTSAWLGVLEFSIAFVKFERDGNDDDDKEEDGVEGIDDDDDDSEIDLKVIKGCLLILKSMKVSFCFGGKIFNIAQTATLRLIASVHVFL